MARPTAHGRRSAGTAASRRAMVPVRFCSAASGPSAARVGAVTRSSTRWASRMAPLMSVPPTSTATTARGRAPGSHRWLMALLLDASGGETRDEALLDESKEDHHRNDRDDGDTEDVLPGGVVLTDELGERDRQRLFLGRGENH